MSLSQPRHDRRWFLQSLTVGIAAFSTPGAFAQQLVETATTTEGPFYPDKLPLDTDNDLLILNDAITPAVGSITLLTGRVLSPSGQPIRNAFVEIWQTDSTGSYVHTAGRQPTGHDRNFQGYGRFLTDAQGRYYFRTIKPVSYTLHGTFRTAHIHFGISRSGRRVFTIADAGRGRAGQCARRAGAQTVAGCAQDVARAFYTGAGVTARRARGKLRCRARTYRHRG